MSTRPVLSCRRQLSKGVALLGCALAAASGAEAAIVKLNLGPSGFNILGQNAGVAYGETQVINNFPVAGARLQIYNYDGYRGIEGDFGGNSPSSPSRLEFAILGGYASPRNFAANESIDGSALWSFNTWESIFWYYSYVSADFGAGSFMGFRFTNDSGSTWNYGWLEVTWDGTNFEILAGAYETTAGLAILASASSGSGAVPLPGAAGLAACGLVGLSRRRRR